MNVSNLKIENPAAASFGMWWYYRTFSGPGRTNLIG
jgi:hypothetical protein